MSQPTSVSGSPPFSQQLAILVFVAFYFVHWFAGTTQPAHRVIQFGAFGVFIVAYFVGFNIRRFTLACACIMVALSFFVAPYNFGSNTFAIYACSFFAYYQPPRRALLFMALTLLVLLASALLHDLHIVYYFGISAIMIFGLGFMGIVDRQRLMHQRQEQQSQEEIRRLAKIAERERISQDLHDVVGHSLTGIHLKAQLALKHIEQNDRQAATQQCAAVAQLAQAALKEIRATLADIKKQSLAQELEAQQRFLQSLQINFHYHIPKAPIPPALEGDLLLVVRELVTNTLRHSHGDAASLCLTSNDQGFELHYRDNGKGLAELDEQHFGNGLRGISQRIHRRKGELKLYNDNGLNLHLTLPWSGSV